MSGPQLTRTDAAVRFDADEVLLALDGVSIAYEDVGSAAVQGVSLQIRQGESVLFLGPSGCGKSTLAMLCAGLIPSSVEAVVSGDIWRAPALNQAGQIGYVFQDPDSQFCMLNVADEIAFGLENQQVPREDMRPRIEHALAQAGLDVPLDAQHATFSGGMKQKLALACALALEPTLLVFDEPTANLDPASSRQVFEQIVQLQRRGQTLLVIEHKFDALLPFMDTVVLFDGTGRVHRVGPTLEVVQSEWDWLVAEGVVPPWKHPPLAVESPAQPKLAAPSRTDPANDETGSADGDTGLADGEIVSLPRRQQVGVADVATVNRPFALELQDGLLRYGNTLVWQDVSVVIPTGEFVAIVGPNGSGKSSLLQAFAGLRRLTAGELTFLGKPTRQWKSRDRFRALAFCFQNPEFQFIYERVCDELANRVVGDEVPAEVTNLLSQFGLNGTALQSPFGLSQGQKRRLSVATMVRDDHEIYLLDEPTFGQDARTQQAIMDRLAALQVSGRTVVMTTHDMDLVRRYATTVLVLAEGGLQFVGPPDDLFLRSDLLRQAHLQDDLLRDFDVPVAGEPSVVGTWTSTPLSTSTGTGATGTPAAVAATTASTDQHPQRRRPPIRALHPGWLFVGLFCSSTVALLAQTLPQAIAVFISSIIVITLLGWMTPWRIAKLLWPFALLDLLYLWSFIANAVVPPGATTLNILWYHISWYGLYPGLVLSARMLGSVLLALLFLTHVDVTDLVVSLCKDLRVPPKFAYGTMAGLRMIPLFTEEWTKLRQARQLRGKDSAVPWLRPVTFMLPLLSQAIRMSERVTIAMEARGLVGSVMERAHGRSFYRDMKPHWWDFAVNAGVCSLIVASVFVR